MPENAGAGSPARLSGRLEPSIRLEAGDGTVVTCARLPRAIGDAVMAVEPLRHGLGNAATSAVCRVHGTAGSAILKVARLPAAADPTKALPASDEPDHGPPRLTRVDDADWDHPSVTVWPAEVRRRLRQLWADPSPLTAIAGAAERTLCHLDVWPANLVDQDGTSVLLDWSFAGDGAVVTHLNHGVTAAKAAAGDKYVNILGASVARQCLEAGLLDEILVCIAPIMLGDGVRLFDHPGGSSVRLERLSLSQAPQATNLWLRVLQ